MPSYVVQSLFPHAETSPWWIDEQIDAEFLPSPVKESFHDWHHQDFYKLQRSRRKKHQTDVVAQLCSRDIKSSCLRQSKRCVHTNTRTDASKKEPNRIHFFLASQFLSFFHVLPGKEKKVKMSTRPYREKKKLQTRISMSEKSFAPPHSLTQSVTPRPQTHLAEGNKIVELVAVGIEGAAN